MKAVERQRHQRVLRMWEGLLRNLEQLGPASEAPEDLNGFGEVKDYIIDRIDERRQLLGVSL